MNAADLPRIREVSSLLSREICRPIDSLRANLVRLLDDPVHPPSEVERTHAATMLALCDDLERLTRDHLGAGDGAMPFGTGPGVPARLASNRAAG